MADETDSGADQDATPPRPFRKTTIGPAEFEDLEAKAIEKLCERFRNRNHDSVDVYTTMADLGTKNQDIARRMFKRLRGIGAIVEREYHPGPGTYTPISRKRTYVVSPSIFEIAAERKAALAEAREPADRVASAERWIRSHPVFSVFVIALFVLTAIVVLLNQLAEFIGRFRN